MSEFYKQLKKAMELNHISQMELCKKTNIPKSAMSQYISGKFKPKQNRTYLIAKALNVNEAWLMGFDDVPMANVGFPGLTTVNVPKEYLGKFAVQKLLERIRSKEPTPTTKTCVNTALVIRDTVKRL